MCLKVANLALFTDSGTVSYKTRGVTTDPATLITHEIDAHNMGFDGKTILQTLSTAICDFGSFSKAQALLVRQKFGVHGS